VRKIGGKTAIFAPTESSKMIFIERRQTDPYFNIAAEEYILKHTAGDVLMFWQSEPSVVVGKHQNTLKEVNLDYVNGRQIPVIRRLSGGGTVYHDKGNINYTLITTSERRETLIDFRKFTQPMIDFLGTLGIEARFEGKNNLTIGGKKFSGNSAHVFKNRVIHHGTFLFNTDLDVLENIINTQTDGIRDKAIASIRATVTNVLPHIDKDLTMEGFIAEMKRSFMDYFQVEKERQFTADETIAIKTLAEEKYKTWQWNIGYSPKYTFCQSINTPEGELNVEISARNGIIEKAEIKLDHTSLTNIEKLITGHHHDKTHLNRILENSPHKKILAKALFPATSSPQDLQL
jgi:lipoate-protein ligase A